MVYSETNIMNKNIGFPESGGQTFFAGLIINSP